MAFQKLVCCLLLKPAHLLDGPKMKADSSLKAGGTVFQRETFGTKQKNTVAYLDTQTSTSTVSGILLARLQRDTREYWVPGRGPRAPTRVPRRARRGIRASPTTAARPARRAGWEHGGSSSVSGWRRLFAGYVLLQAQRNRTPEAGNKKRGRSVVYSYCILGP